MAIARELQHGFANPEAAIAERLQIDPTNDDIPSDQLRGDSVHPEYRGNGFQMFALYERDLAFTARPAGIMVTFESRIGVGDHRFNGFRGREAFSSDADPVDDARLAMRHQKRMECGILVHGVAIAVRWRAKEFIEM